MLVSDEEIGGKNGARYLVEEENYRPSFLIAGEPSGYATGHLTIAVSHKGFLHLNIEAHGKSAHGSRPWKGENAIEKLMHKYREIKKLFEPTTPENRWKATVNLGRIRGGKTINRLPDHAEMDLDIRYTEETPPEEIVERIRAIEDIDVTVIAKGSVSHTSPDHPRIQALKDVTEQATGKECGFHRLHGSADSRFFAAEGVSSVEFGPVGTNLHSIDECVTVQSLVDYHRIIKEFAQREG
jgi:succinyl-diaminopimelate desuccinylase